MARVGGKAKTRKSVAKRFKVTGSGKLVRRRQGKRHLLRRKNSGRRRRLGQDAVVAECDQPRMKECLPFS